MLIFDKKLLKRELGTLQTLTYVKHHRYMGNKEILDLIDRYISLLQELAVLEKKFQKIFGKI